MRNHKNCKINLNGLALKRKKHNYAINANNNAKSIVVLAPSIVEDTKDSPILPIDLLSTCNIPQNVARFFLKL